MDHYGTSIIDEKANHDYENVEYKIKNNDNKSDAV